MTLIFVFADEGFFFPFYSSYDRYTTLHEEFKDAFERKITGRGLRKSGYEMLTTTAFFLSSPIFLEYFFAILYRRLYSYCIHSSEIESV